MTRLFGTDGIRGRYGEGWLTTDAVYVLGQVVGAAFARKAGSSGPRRALVGHDGRRSGPPLEGALARGLAEAGFEVQSAGLIPTPAIATLAQKGDFALAAMISASHNPAGDNGIKLFGNDGEKLPDELEGEIEAELLRRGSEDAKGKGEEGDTPLRHEPGLEDLYLNRMLQAVPGLKLDGIALVLDCANGAASRVAPRILGRLGAQVISLACSPDGGNINEDCGSTHPARMQETVRLHGAGLGIALDGDGDRCLLCDERGALVNGDGMMTLLARHASSGDTLQPKRIVATVMSNRGLHRAMREIGVGVETVGVGDRRVVEALRRDGLPLGGEQSGHIVFGADNGYVGDGIYTALRCLQVLVESGAPLSELAAAYQPFPQVLINVPVRSRPDLSEVPAVLASVKQIEDELGEDGRVLLRYSGTEPLARVMVEGPDESRIRTQAQGLADDIAREIGA